MRRHTVDRQGLPAELDDRMSVVDDRDHVAYTPGPLNRDATFHKQNIVSHSGEKSHRVRDDNHRVTTIHKRPQQRP